MGEDMLGVLAAMVAIGICIRPCTKEDVDGGTALVGGMAAKYPAGFCMSPVPGAGGMGMNG